MDQIIPMKPKRINNSSKTRPIYTPLSNFFPTFNRMRHKAIIHYIPPHLATEAKSEKQVLPILNSSTTEGAYFSLVTKASLNTSQGKKECRGIAIENHTIFHQCTTFSFSLRAAQVSAQLYTHFLDFQIARFSTPIFTNGS
jgi:hypothetical protein